MAKPDAFLTYRTVVPDDVRDALAETVGEIDFEDFGSIARGYNAVLKAVLKGNLPPTVAAEARELINGALLAKAAKESGKGTIGAGAMMLVQILNRIEAHPSALPAVEPSYTTPIETNAQGRQIVDVLAVVADEEE